ncbi:DUF7344 domain-containing protein [Halobacterium wangiae]|uniref:DUF7344 domain-containing protein n=1 Tax=Halobacterium wangiae TaxID=2902623 RepID=UPI001E5CBDE5|nr:hypothetical protein [Halobacterium wangiae]
MKMEENPEPAHLGSNRELRLGRRRELVLTTVENRELPLSLTELAEAVADQSADSDADTLRVRLHHVHLPVLEERGALEYDPSRNVVSDCYVSPR